MHRPQTGSPLGRLAGAALVLSACRFASLRPLREASSGAPSTPKATLPPLASLLPSLTPAATLEPTPTFALPAVPADSTHRAPRGSLRACLLYPDLTYCTGGETQLKLDFYALPEPAVTPRPLVVFVHGGAWMRGDKAASGVYIWRVVCGHNSKIGKLMVIW